MLKDRLTGPALTRLSPTLVRYGVRAAIRSKKKTAAWTFRCLLKKPLAASRKRSFVKESFPTVVDKTFCWKSARKSAAFRLANKVGGADCRKITIPLFRDTFRRS